MKLQNYILMTLTNAGEVQSAENFSQHWCKKNRNWFAWQKHAGQDFSVDAAINCLAHTRQRLQQSQDDASRDALREVEELLSDYLLHKYKISEICSEHKATPIRHSPRRPPALCPSSPHPS